ARPRPLNAHFDFLQTELRRLLGAGFGGALGGKRRTLTAALEADRTGRRAAECVTIGVGDGDDRVVERRLDVRNAPADVPPSLTLLAFGHLGIPREAEPWCRVGSRLPHFLHALLT